MTRFVLGLDQAARSGWAIAPERSRVLEHGVAYNVQAQILAIEKALHYAGGPENLLVMFEQHDHMPLTRLTRFDHKTKREGRSGGVERGPKQIFGMGKAYGRWEALCWERGIPERMCDEVQPREWRAVFGIRGSGDAVKRAALEYVRREGADITDHNEAEAWLLTTWAALHGFARLDARRQKARIEARAKRAEKAQGALFELPDNDNATLAASRKAPW